MKDEKIKSTAKKISEFFSNTSTPTELYREFIRLVNNQKDYFLMRFMTYELIKIVIYIWSLKKTGQFDFGDKILNDLEFITLSYHNNEKHTIDCPDCNSNSYGKVHCPNCEGFGTLECDDCNGRGRVYCPNCGGNDPECTECDHNGRVFCEPCDGYGRIGCLACDEGYITCPNCNGTSEIETERILQSIVYLMSWNPNLNFDAKKSEETLGPLMSTDELIDYEENYIMTTIKHGHNSFDPEVILPDLYYTIDVDDDPPLILDANLSISWKFDESKLERLVLGQ